MRGLLLIFVLAMAGGLYFTSPPKNGESAMHYILLSTPDWKAMACVIVASCALSAMIMVLINERVVSELGGFGLDEIHQAQDLIMRSCDTRNT